MSDRQVYFRFLDAVREGGSINMFGAAPVLRQAFEELSAREATLILVDWMETFSDRHPQEEGE